MASGKSFSAPNDSKKETDKLSLVDMTLNEPSSSNSGSSGSKTSNSPLESPQDKLAKSAVSKVGQFLLLKCTNKRREDRGIQDEYFLADDLQGPDDTTRNILAKFEKQIKSRITNELKCPTPKKLLFIGYKTQQVSGKDYFIKVKAPNSGQYFHIRIYESLQHDFLLQNIAGPKLNSDKIEIDT